MIIRDVEGTIHYFCEECKKEIDKLEYAYCPYCGHHIDKPEIVGMTARSSRPCTFTNYRYGLFEYDGNILFKPDSVGTMTVYDIHTGRNFSDILPDSDIYPIVIDIK